MPYFFFQVGAVGALDFKSVIQIESRQTAIFKEGNQTIYIVVY
jgi:hypothetical protein